MHNVALVKGNRSYDAVKQALELIKGEVEVPASKPVLVKPNLVSARVDLSATPVDAVRAVLDFLKEKGVKHFILGEGTAEGATMDAFKRFGYTALKDEYDLELRDLNRDATVEAVVLGADLKPAKLRISRTFVDSYRVSVARMKTHDTVIVTLAVKNMGVGSVVNADRRSFSHAYPAMNLSLARMEMDRPTHLAIIDGVVGMEGAGPVSGTARPTGVALAGINATAVDVVGAQVMGYNPAQIGYLHYLMHLQGFSPLDIAVLGENVEACTSRYKDHPDYRAQRKWQVEDWHKVIMGNP